MYSKKFISYLIKSLSFCVFIQLFSISNLHSTVQIPDYVILENDTFLMYQRPFNDYLIAQDIDKYELLKKFSWNTACFNKYYAIWSIKDSNLYLNEIRDCDYARNKRLLDLKKIFGNKYRNKRVQSFWVNGILKIKNGDKYCGYTYFENEVILQVVKGKICKISKYKNKSIESDDGYIKIERISFYMPIPKNMELCFYVNRSYDVNSICYCDTLESIIINGGFSISDTIMYEKEQLKYNQSLLMKIIDSTSGSFNYYNKNQSALFKWFNCLWSDGKNSSKNEWIRLYTMSGFYQNIWFIFKIRNKTQKEFEEICDKILSNIYYSGL